MHSVEPVYAMESLGLIISVLIIKMSFYAVNIRIAYSHYTTPIGLGISH